MSVFEQSKKDIQMEREVGTVTWFGKGKVI